LGRYGSLGTSESIASSAVKTCIDVNAKAIIVCSESGATAAQVAKFRPGRPVTVLTTSGAVARQCYGVLKGCDAILLPSLEATEQIVNETIEGFKKSGIATAGDAIVVVHGTSARVGATNVMRIQYA
jgi:pyruvate kinase